MEPESHQREAEETEFQPPSMPILCANNCGFFGSSATNNLCSKCYKDFSMSMSKASIESVVVAPAVEASKVDANPGAGDDGEAKDVIFHEEGNPSSGDAPPAKKPGNRCISCNKRVGLMGFKCRCGDVFCPSHRYSDKHNCPFDYKGTGQDAIAKANPVVKPDKVGKI